MERIKDFIIALFNIDVTGVSQAKYDAAVARAEAAEAKESTLMAQAAMLKDNFDFAQNQIGLLQQNETALMEENAAMLKDLKAIAEKCGEWGSAQ